MNLSLFFLWRSCSSPSMLVSVFAPDSVSWTLSCAFHATTFPTLTVLLGSGLCFRIKIAKILLKIHLEGSFNAS